MSEKRKIINNKKYTNMIPMRIAMSSHYLEICFPFTDISRHAAIFSKKRILC